MFILKGLEDGSVCKLDDHEVICDENSVQIGNEVTFIWSGKSYKGIVMAFSGEYI